MTSDQPPVASREVLLQSEELLIDFLVQNPSKDAECNFSNVQGYRLPERQLKEPGANLSAATVQIEQARVTASSAGFHKKGRLDADDLMKRLAALAAIADRDQTGDPFPRRMFDHSRPTSESQSSGSCESSTEYETLCRDELVSTGGRPVLPLTFLSDPDSLKDERERDNTIGAWVDYSIKGERANDLPLVFSSQVNEWHSFRQQWQWHNRGATPKNDGLDAYLDWHTRLYRSGRPRVKHIPSSTILNFKGLWDRHRIYRECPNGEGFEAYQQAVKKRLLSHGFSQPFELMENPGDQDSWTTWVEYLNYIYWWKDRFARLMTKNRDKYNKAWRFLEKGHSWSGREEPWPPRRNVWESWKSQSEKIGDIIQTFLNDTRVYKNMERLFWRQELRAQWALRQLAQIEAERNESAIQGAANSSTAAKRKSAERAAEVQQEAKRSRKQTEQAGQDERPSKRSKAATTGPLRRSARLAEARLPKT